jgi:hypothetical protein
MPTIFLISAVLLAAALATSQGLWLLAATTLFSVAGTVLFFASYLAAKYQGQWT